MREFLTTLGVGIGMVACVFGGILAVSHIGASAIELLVAPGTPPPGFSTQMATGIVLLAAVGICWGIGRVVRGVLGA